MLLFRSQVKWDTNINIILDWNENRNQTDANVEIKDFLAFLLEQIFPNAFLIRNFNNEYFCDIVHTIKLRHQ